MTETLTSLIRDPFQPDVSALVTGQAAAHEMAVPPLSVKETLVGDVDRERAFRLCLSRVQDYRDLPEDWDTYGGLPASAAAAGFAIDLLNRLGARPTIAPPDVQPISTGVYLEWHFSKTTLYFEVDEDSVLFVMRKGDDVMACGEDPFFDVSRAVEHVRRFHQDDIGMDD